MIMCHMVADTRAELLEMADKIGVQRKWIQEFDTYREHFDISLAKRKLAVKYGAKEVTMKELSKITLEKERSTAIDEERKRYLSLKRKTKALGTPFPPFMDISHDPTA